MLHVFFFPGVNQLFNMSHSMQLKWTGGIYTHLKCVEDMRAQMHISLVVHYKRKQMTSCWSIWHNNTKLADSKPCINSTSMTYCTLLPLTGFSFHKEKIVPAFALRYLFK